MNKLSKYFDSMHQKPVLILDGLNQLIRHTMINFHSINGAGQCIGGIEGCIKEISRLIRDFRPKAVFFVAESGSLRKSSLFSGYKKHRKLEIRAKSSIVKEESEVREMLTYQLNILGSFLPYLKVHYVYVPFVEADDVISVISQVTKPNIIISNDSDFLQLHNFTDTFVYDPKKKRVLEDKDIKSYGEEYALLKSICGDRTDNIKGIGRVGWKKILKWKGEIIINTLEELVNLAREKNDRIGQKILQEYDIIARNYELICLKPEITYNKEMQKILLETLSTPVKLNFGEALKIFKKEGLDMGLVTDNAMMFSILET